MGFYQSQMAKRAEAISNLGSSILKGASKIALSKGIKSSLASMNKRTGGNSQELTPVEMINNAGGNTPIVDNTSVNKTDDLTNQGGNK